MSTTLLHGKSVPKVKITTKPSTHIAAPKNTAVITTKIITPVVVVSKSPKSKKGASSSHKSESTIAKLTADLIKLVKPVKPIQPVHANKGGGYNWGIIENPYCQ
jgi:hypothetical protein